MAFLAHTTRRTSLCTDRRAQEETAEHIKSQRYFVVRTCQVLATRRAQYFVLDMKGDRKPVWDINHVGRNVGVARESKTN